jgi:hypothetical protein
MKRVMAAKQRAMTTGNFVREKKTTTGFPMRNQRAAWNARTRRSVAATFDKKMEAKCCSAGEISRLTPTFERLATNEEARRTVETLGIDESSRERPE